jgi:GNAT superfamily N-acetyltransferase
VQQAALCGSPRTLGHAKDFRIMPTVLEYRSAKPADIAECIDIRGMTRDNAISAMRLSEMGITLESWSEHVRTNSLPGVVCVSEDRIVGYSFCDRMTGEVVVLALRPEYENQGIGRKLLERIVELLSSYGHATIFLRCSSDPKSRSYGFYRHIGWRTTNAFDENNDEILELHVQAAGVA